MKVSLDRTAPTMLPHEAVWVHVSLPGSVKVYVKSMYPPSLTEAAPEMVTSGATLLTVTEASSVSESVSSSLTWMLGDARSPLVLVGSSSGYAQSKLPDLVAWLKVLFESTAPAMPHAA